MKKTIAVLLLLLGSTVGINAAVIADTIKTKTTIRIILPDSTGNWQYYFATDDKGHAPQLLSGKENVVTITTTKRNANGYIYAKSIDQTKQTNNYSFNLKGKPVYLVVIGNNGAIVTAKRCKITKYTILRNAIPEAKRAPWN